MALYSLEKASIKTNNIIYNCPHSGEHFPNGFLNTTSINKEILLASGDSYVDKLFSEVKNSGSHLLINNYARSFVDTNREAFELDPEMFSGKINQNLNSNSPKVKLGYGTIAKFAYTRKNIYSEKIPFEDALKRIVEYYHPIHETLNALLIDEINKYHYALLIDCHSMPSYEFLGHTSTKYKQPDIILGNRFGKSCNKAITDYITNHFQCYDLTVSHNAPFAGGYNTENYSNLRENKQAIQIEFKRSLYMDENKREVNAFFKPLKIIIGTLCHQLNKDISSLIKKSPSKYCG